MSIDNNTNNCTVDAESNRSYYCSMKFRYLKIDLQAMTTYNCHAAQPHVIDFSWLKNNQGRLFNTPTNVKERQMMLINQRNPSCEQNCWPAEDIGAISPRISQKGIKITHTNPIVNPESLDITVNSNCNLTCTYCTKEFSSAWRNDILKNGRYEFSSGNNLRYDLSSKDKVLMKISQLERKKTEKYQILIKEIEQIISNVKQIDITGGEPFLDNSLVEMLTSLKMNKDCKIHLFTGLGVSVSRFDRILKELSKFKNLIIIISAENIGKFLEFNRYGIKWDEFESKLEKIKASGINFRFHATMSNLTIFGYREFYDYFLHDKKVLLFAYQPKMMSSHVMDNDSKKALTEQFESLPLMHRDQLIKSMSATPNESDRIDFREFLLQFIQRRRDINLSIYPPSFLRWLDIDHVV